MLILDYRKCWVIFALLIVYSRPTQSKIYDRCELARELHFVHGIALNQIATWVCLAQRESLFNTAAVGHLNADGSADHGLFQISDLFWCSHDYGGGKACDLACSDLLDNDITNDVRCIKTIFEEHNRLTGDGFNAWTTYQPFCLHQDYKHVANCFQNKQRPPVPQGSFNSIQDTNALRKKFESNPFLKHVYAELPQASTQSQVKIPFPKAQSTQPGYKYPPHTQTARPVKVATSPIAKYSNNPFLKHIQPNSRTHSQPPRHNEIHRTKSTKVSTVNSFHGKVYTRCSLAQELYTKHSFPLQDIATWVCIAEHQSSLNTAAVGRANGDGSANYGLFQISDRYWCFADGASTEGKACNVPCSKLIDDDLTDDVSCVRTIYAEHTRISGDGFNAWTVYQPHCQHQNIEQIRQCFTEKDLKAVQSTTINEIAPVTGKRGKIYQRCELAQELYHKHKLPLDQIATWVCIAQHESSFNTAAVGRLNTDGSADHGLFQISDLYWCTHDRYGGKACNIACDRLLDSDITDDVECITIIHEEHTRISGDGFNAWAVYQPHCRNKGVEQIKQCFSDKELKGEGTKSTGSFPNGNSFKPQTAVATSKKGKIYSKCELAQELYYKHKMPLEQIPTWVCIAQHESSYNTAAVGRLNTDGSADHGLFQISDLYWCTHDQYGGKACNIPCDKLLDSDISDDVRCIQIIHDEHTRISGDGFNAWTVYKPHCRNKGMDHVKQCFPEKELNSLETIYAAESSVNALEIQAVASSKKGKIYNKCELAKELYHKHKLPMQQIPTWVCIAQHESSYNTAAVGRLNADGSADHGLFQISDLYWCTHDQRGGKACNIPCHKLLDSDISDDVHCIKIIHEEHTRISGDGFNAWAVYKPHCRNKGLDLIKQCFSEKDLKEFGPTSVTSSTTNSIQHETSVAVSKKGKIYNKCELAQELYHKHKLPMEQIPTWVCIAQHESSYNTAAVGRLNTDGSADHGLFQISDLYWCTHDQYGGKACNIPCSKLLDSDLTDDVHCIKIIHEEHTRISGDGFNAWTVYKPHCRNKGLDHVKQCFSEQEIKTIITSNAITPISNSIQPIEPSYNPQKGKIYKKCELAQELLVKHKMPMEQIPTWVCIAQHESSFNTAAVGRLNTDGSADHGLFQISDLYWCTHDRLGGKACNIPCDKLLDSDITDDVRCIRIIHEEHTQLSGDGFNAWAVYRPHCRNRKLDEIRNCFSGNEIQLYESSKLEFKAPNKLQISQKTSNYASNPFLQNAHKITATAQQKQQNAIKVSATFSSSKVADVQNYKNNPFLNGAIKISTNVQQSMNVVQQSAAYNMNNYKNNPFLNGAIKMSTSAQQSESYLYMQQTTPKSYISDHLPNSQKEGQQVSKTVSPSQQPTKVSPTAQTTIYQSTQPTKNYLDSGNFRTKTTTTATSKTSASFITTKKPVGATKLSTATTKKPQTKIPANTTLKPTTSFTTTTLKTTTKSPTTPRTVRTTGTTSKPHTTKPQTTAWSWNDKYRQTTKTTKPKTVVTTTKTTAKLISMATTKKPTSIAPLATIKSSVTKISTTTRKPTTSAWNWNDRYNQKSTTVKPSTYWLTTQKTLNTPTTRKSTTYWTTTTKRPEPAPKPTATWSWDKAKLKKTSMTTTRKPVTSSTIVKKPVTTTRKPTISQSRTTKTSYATTTTKVNSGQYIQSVATGKLQMTQKPTTTSRPTTTKAQTTKSSTSWSRHDTTPIRKSTSATTRKPATTTTKVTIKTAKSATTTRKPVTTTLSAITKLPTTARNSAWQQHSLSSATTKSPQVTTTKSSQLQTKTTKSTYTQRTTTKRPATSWNWQQSKYDNSTAITRTTTKYPILSGFAKATVQQQQQYFKTTTKPYTSTIKSSRQTINDKRTSTTTGSWSSNSWNTWLGDGNKTVSTTKATTTKSPTAKLVTTKSATTKDAKRQQVVTSLRQSDKTTTAKPVTTSINLAVTSPQKSADLYKQDPFSHPFFDRVKEKINRLRGDNKKAS